MVKGDLDYLLKALSEFFNNQEVQQKLSFFKNDERIDLEKWLQCEVHYFFATTKECEVWHECSYELDGRTALGKGQIVEMNGNRKLIDLAFRRKGQAKDLYTLVELKVSRFRDNCLNKMIQDYKKLKSIKKSQLDARSCWCVGLFYDRDEYKEKDHQKWLLKYLSRPEYNKMDIHAEVMSIADTGFVMVII